jgi:hypothetical protein
MLRCVPWDVLYSGGELLTGKSIPVLVAIAVLPIGQALGWAVVTLGAITGTLFSVYAVHKGGGGSLSLLSCGNRLLQLCFSLGLTLSLLLSLANGIHPGRGASLTVVPAFCLATLTLPQRASTALVSAGLCVLVFYMCILTDAGHMNPTPISPAAKGAPTPAATLSLGEVIQRASQLFVLAFYACVQHAPTQVYFDLRGLKPAYASHHHATYAGYTLLIGLITGWIRVCVFTAVCFMRDNVLHAMLEAQHAAVGWPCTIIYMIALLYSACWTATQLREQVLPRFGLESEVDRVKILVCVTALAVLHRQRSPSAMFYAADTLAGLAVATALVHISPDPVP